MNLFCLLNNIKMFKLVKYSIPFVLYYNRKTIYKSKIFNDMKEDFNILKENFNNFDIIKYINVKTNDIEFSKNIDNEYEQLKKKYNQKDLLSILEYNIKKKELDEKLNNEILEYEAEKNYKLNYDNVKLNVLKYFDKNDDVYLDNNDGKIKKCIHLSFDWNHIDMYKSDKISKIYEQRLLNDVKNHYYSNKDISDVVYKDGKIYIEYNTTEELLEKFKKYKNK